jgi:two-component system cell cycle response regulator CpdR
MLCAKGTFVAQPNRETRPEAHLFRKEASADELPHKPKARILLAEDDELIRSFVSTALVDAGFEVATAVNGQKAWELILGGYYDLLLTDNDMPELTGLGLIERLSRSGRTLPVIVASGRFLTEDLQSTWVRPVAAVIAKPYGLRQLLDTVAEVLKPSFA